MQLGARGKREKAGPAGEVALSVWWCARWTDPFDEGASAGRVTGLDSCFQRKTAFRMTRPTLAAALRRAVSSCQLAETPHALGSLV